MGIGRYNAVIVVPQELETGRTPAFSVGEWLVQPSLNRLVRGEEVASLEPKVMQVLLCLARRAGEVVSRRVIVDEVWRTEFVADNTLTHAVFDLRRVFGDDPGQPRYIETITRRGYRLLPPVEHLGILPAPGAGDTLGCAIVVDGVQIVLARGDNLIGRSADVAILVRSTEVSRHHARVVVAADGATLEDLGSKNGTYLWGERVVAPTRLEDGDEIAVGPSLLVFQVLPTMGTTQTARSAERDPG